MIVTPTLLILQSVVFILVWIFIRTIDNRKWLTILVSLILTPLVYFYILYPIINIFSDYHHKKYFDAQDWKDKPALRFEMANHLLKDSLLFNKNKKEVQQLLGSSEWYGWDTLMKANSPHKWNYNLGLKPGAFNTSIECIEVKFNNEYVEWIRSYQIEQKFE